MIKNKTPQLAPGLAPQQVVKVIWSHIDALGRRAPAYGHTERVDELRAYLRMFLEPYLRDLKNKHIITDFKIGISTTFFFHPKLRITLPNGKNYEYPLNKFILGERGNRPAGIIL